MVCSSQIRFDKGLLSHQVASIGLYVQMFFLNRLYAISERRLWIVVPIAVLLAFAYCAICVAVSVAVSRLCIALKWLQTYYITLGEAAGPKIALWCTYSSIRDANLAYLNHDSCCTPVDSFR